MKERLPSAKFKLSTRWSGAERFTLAIPQVREPSLLTAVRNGPRNIGFGFGIAISVILLALEKQDGFDIR